MTTYIATSTLSLNGSEYVPGEIIHPEDVPTTKLRRFIDRGLIEAIGSDAQRSAATYTSASLAANAQETGVITPREDLLGADSDDQLPCAGKAVHRHHIT